MRDKNLPAEYHDSIKELVQELLAKYHRPASEIVLDDVELREMLKISRRTALNYRQSGRLKSYKVDNKIFYFLSEILEFIKANEQSHV